MGWILNIDRMFSSKQIVTENVNDFIINNLTFSVLRIQGSTLRSSLVGESAAGLFTFGGPKLS